MWPPIAAAAFLLLTTRVSSDSSVTAGSSATCETSLSEEIQSFLVLINDSVLDTARGIEYPPGSYLKVEGENGTSYRGCPCSLSERPCLRKCCPLGMIMDENWSCINHEEPFAINVTDGDGVDLVLVDGEKHFFLLYGSPCHSGSFTLDPENYPEDEFYVRSSDGILLTPQVDATEYGPKDFCLDYFTDTNAYIPLMCNSEEFTKENESKWLIYVLYPLFMMISIPCLLVTFLVYVLISELRNLHGKSLACHVGCLLLTYVFLSVVQLFHLPPTICKVSAMPDSSCPRYERKFNEIRARTESSFSCLTNHVGTLLVTYTFLVVVQLGKRGISQGICKTSAFIIEFAFLGTYFWLNVMCFDICIAFSRMRPLLGSLKERENKKFMFYSLYAWGCPSIILIISLIMDFTPGIPDHYIKPRFGRNRCWFDRKMDAFAFFFGPVAMLITSNIIMFIVTAVNIVRVKRQTDKVIKGGRSDDKENRNRFNLYLKLLLVMGVNWIMELISWAVDGPDYLWYVTDIGNILQGVFIFIIFVWKEKIRSIVIQKLCPKMATMRSQGGSSPGIRRIARGSSPNKSSMSGGTTSSWMSYQTGDNVQLKPIE